MKSKKNIIPLALLLSLGGTSCQQKSNEGNKGEGQKDSIDLLLEKSVSRPLIEDQFTADPSAHVFNGKLYLYPSHDLDLKVEENDQGDHFNMQDYHVFSMDSVGGKITDHGQVLGLDDIPWAKKQLWAPDVAEKDGKYYLYFPAKDQDDIFRIGVAVGNSPEGPFKASDTPVKGSYSIDPAAFADEDGNYYLYFGGIWGGQLQRWDSGAYDVDGSESDRNEPEKAAIRPRIAKLSQDMKAFAEPVREIKLLDESGNELLGGDHDRRFFEGAWMHKYKGKYYFSYSTGDTHRLVYAIGDSPYGPFTYQGVITEPVLGWTTHHSIVEHQGKWYLFYHDTELSKGKTHLRNVKVTDLHYDTEGRIQTIDPYGK